MDTPTTTISRLTIVIRDKSGHVISDQTFRSPAANALAQKRSAAR